MKIFLDFRKSSRIGRPASNQKDKPKKYVSKIKS